MENFSPAVRQRYQNLQNEAKALAAEGSLAESLRLFKKAAAIHKTPKIESRIKRLRDLLEESNDDDDDNDNEEVEGKKDEVDGLVEVTPGFRIHETIHKKLYSYQKEGVAWLYQLYLRKKGGILGDDMGLGKTFQVIAFLSGMIDAQLIHSSLIIMPVSLLPNWANEFQKWCPGIQVYEFHGSTKRSREQELNRAQRRGGILLTSYGMIVTSHELFSHLNGREFVWDYVVLDEGHKIKNPTKTTKAVHEVPAKNRLVITGTAIQNNLMELWALYDFCHQGSLLGSMKTFKQQYEIPITRSREKCCTMGEQKLGDKIAQSLMKLISPYFLRRTKEQVLQRQVVDAGGKLKKMELNPLPDKNDFIVWVYLTGIQRDLYENFLNSDAVKSILVTSRSPLVELTVLKKICDHPRLFSHHSCQELGLNNNKDADNISEALEENVSTIANVSDALLMAESGKMATAIALLENLRTNGHRTLVFSLSRKILDMIQRILHNKGWKVLRIDGTITKIVERARRIHLFQTDKSWSVFLLTTQVGGVGITLTAADRVIIYDPSWNPATDAQAVDRIYRIGQTQRVIVYRLITCATVEEKIYRRQIFKDSIMRQTTGNQKNPHRYFSKQDLRELFQLDDITQSKTQMQLAAMHSHERKTNVDLDEHVAFLHSLDIFGISDHDLMFSKNARVDPDEAEDDQYEMPDAFIEQKVQMAQKLVEHEGAVAAQGYQSSNSYVKPFALPIQPGTSKKIADNYKAPDFPEILELKNLNINDVANTCEFIKEVLHRPATDDFSTSEQFPVSKGFSDKFNQRMDSSHSDSIVIIEVDSKLTDEKQGNSLNRSESSDDDTSHSFKDTVAENASSSPANNNEDVKQSHLFLKPFDSPVQNVKRELSFSGSGDSLKKTDSFSDNKESLKSLQAPVGDTSARASLDRSPNEVKPIHVPEFEVKSENESTETLQSDDSSAECGPSYNVTENSTKSDDSVNENAQSSGNNLSVPDSERIQQNPDFDFLNLSDDEDIIVATNKRKSKRKSCVLRRSTMLLSDSESSCPSNNVSDAEILASDSEDEFYQEHQSSNSSGQQKIVPRQINVLDETPKSDILTPRVISVVKHFEKTPDCATVRKNMIHSFETTPRNKGVHYIDGTSEEEDLDSSIVKGHHGTPTNTNPFKASEKTPNNVSFDIKSSGGTPQSGCKMSTPIGPVRNFQNSFLADARSPKRITPLRVSHVPQSPQKAAFDKAMNASIEFPIEPCQASMSRDLDDSDVAIAPKARRRRILSDSDDDDDNPNMSLKSSADRVKKSVTASHKEQSSCLSESDYFEADSGEETVFDSSKDLTNEYVSVLDETACSGNVSIAIEDTSQEDSGSNYSVETSDASSINFSTF